MDKKDILSYDFDDLVRVTKELDIPAFRAKQMYQWLWKHLVSSFDEMENLPKEIRARLQEEFAIVRMNVETSQKSQDGTIKAGFKTHDNNYIEGVIIPAEGRITACISSQVGCTLQCQFCATGFLPRVRNLMAYEIFEQVYLLNQMSIKELGGPLTNIVYMGMGEPLMNYREVVRSLHLLHDNTYGLGIGAKRMTVSTSGIPNNIRKLANEGIKVNLALSLHASDDTKRKEIMDIAHKHTIAETMDAMKYFYEKTKNRLTYEYLLLKNFNDSSEDAAKLLTLTRDFPVLINLIEYNPVEGTPYMKTPKEQRERFFKHLRDAGVETRVRISRGKDIDAACGQLANKIFKKSVI